MTALLRPFCLLSVAALPLLACGGPDVLCTLVGYSSEVRLQVPASAEVAEFCVAGDCVEPGTSEPSIPVGFDDPFTYDYRIVITLEEGQGQVIEGDVTTEEYFANGEGCEPRTANATLTVRDDGEVEVTHP